jgi:hypothetical protein
MIKWGVVSCVVVLAACQGSQKGSTTDYHLQEHSVAISGKKVASLITDCRGNGSLAWEVLDSDNFKQPKKVGLYCGMYLSPPSGDDFKGWGKKKTNWAQLDACTMSTSSKFGESSCSDYLRALRDTERVTAPWCQLLFYYEAPTTTKFKVVTYCR